MAAHLQDSPPTYWDSVKYAAGHAAEEVWGDKSAGLLVKSFSRGLNRRTEADDWRNDDPYAEENNRDGFVHPDEPVFADEYAPLKTVFYDVNLDDSGLEGNNKRDRDGRAPTMPELTGAYEERGREYSR